MTALLDARGLLVQTRHSVNLLHDVNLGIKPGQVVSLIGPNGAGKSTLLSVLAGTTAPIDGTVRMNGDPVGSLTAPELALRRAVLTQDHQVGFAFTVEQVITMGRHPHRRSATPAQDSEAIATAVAAMELEGLLHRRITDLSGGEQARCAIARVLAQTTPLFLLDEPTAALDLRYQHRLLTHCEQLADEGAAVLMVIHDLTLAARADLVGLIHDKSLLVDTPNRVLTASNLEAAYNVAVNVRSTRSGVAGVDLALPARVSRTTARPKE